MVEAMVSGSDPTLQEARLLTRATAEEGEGGEGGEEKDGRRGFGDSEAGDLVGRAGEREITRSPVIGAVGII